MEYLLNRSETVKKNNKYYNITKTIGITEFVSVMNKL
jgi:hypothetical protein